MGEQGLSRSKDGAPSYDGSADTLALYREEAVQYMFTLEYHKRYLAGPRLAQELRGVARVVIRKKLAQDPQWLSHPRGAYTLVDYFEKAIDRPTLVQAAQHIQKFFYQLRRRRGESMTQWTSRHSESLWEASRALMRVKKDHGFSDSFTDGGSRTRDDRSLQWRDASRTWSSSASHHDEEYFDENGRLIEEDDTEDQDHEWNWGSQSWSNSWSDWRQGSWRSAEYQPPDSWETDVEDFLPDYLNAFLLLQRSGLDAGERANILAAIHGRFSADAVSRALKEQWSDEDLLRRDKAKQSAFLTFDEDEPNDEDFGQALAVDMPDRHHEPEAYAAFMEEQTTINEAMAAIEHQKQTLKEARWRQSQVRKSRSFYPMAKYTPEASRRGRGPETCLKCGGPHTSSSCPVRKETAKVVEEEAQVVFSAAEETALTGTTTTDPILQGKGIIDCGATSTLGSIAAVENIMTHNVQSGGSDRVKVIPEPGPTFRFGNNQTTSCVSSVDLGIEHGFQGW